MAVTIKDVAKLANVAPSTVSRVIANNPRISQQTKERVREAMDKLGYHPNLNARSLANRSTQTIGLVMPSSGEKTFQNPFFPEVIRGISTKAHEIGYSLQMTTGNTQEEIHEGVVCMVQGSQVDGIVLLYSRIDDSIIDYLLEKRFPFVVIGKPYRYADQITHIDNDNVKAAKEATQYLIANNHEQIAFVGGDLNLVVTVDRLLGFEAAIREAGLHYRDDYVVQSEFLSEGGRRAIDALMSLKSPPTALVVADDLMAFGIVNHLKEKHMNVPEDISIISFNNVMLAELSSPPLSSIDINIFTLGYDAVSHLIENMTSDTVQAKRVTIPHHLVERQSCRVRT